MSSRLVTVRLENLPVELATRAQSHLDSLVRESALIESPGTDRAATRLRTLVTTVRERFRPFTDQARATFARAINEGVEAITLEVTVPEEAAVHAAELNELLDEIDGHCRSGALVTLAMPAQTIALRQWYLGEFIRQAAGALPRPWHAPSAQGATRPG